MNRRNGRRNRWRAGLRASTSVNLISMMDILTTLLLFLLKSYVAGGEVMVPQPGVRLPASTAEQMPAASLVIAIDGDAIRVGDEKVASVAEVASTGALQIDGLARRLELVAAQQAAGADSTGKGRIVTIQGDRDIEYALLRKVMFTLSRSGYDNVSLAVIRKA